MCMYRATQIQLGKCREVYTSAVNSGYSTRWWSFISSVYASYNNYILCNNIDLYCLVFEDQKKKTSHCKWITDWVNLGKLGVMESWPPPMYTCCGPHWNCVRKASFYRQGDMWRSSVTCLRTRGWTITPTHLTLGSQEQDFPRRPILASQPGPLLSSPQLLFPGVLTTSHPPEAVMINCQGMALGAGAHQEFQNELMVLSNRALQGGFPWLCVPIQQELRGLLPKPPNPGQ